MAAALSTHAASCAAEYIFLAILYLTRYTLPFLRLLAAKHSPEDVALTVIIVFVEITLIAGLLGQLNLVSQSSMTDMHIQVT